MFIESWMRLAARQEASALGQSKSLSHPGGAALNRFLSLSENGPSRRLIAPVILNEAKDLLTVNDRVVHGVGSNKRERERRW
jgi:hypothetical protein